MGSFTAALESNRYFLEAYLARGFFYVRDLPQDQRRDGMAAQAMKDFEDAVKLEPTKAICYFGRACAQRLQCSMISPHRCQAGHILYIIYGSQLARVIADKLKLFGKERR